MSVDLDWAGTPFFSEFFPGRWFPGVGKFHRECSQIKSKLIEEFRIVPLPNVTRNHSGEHSLKQEFQLRFFFWTWTYREEPSDWLEQLTCAPVSRLERGIQLLGGQGAALDLSGADAKPASGLYFSRFCVLYRFPYLQID